MFGRLLLVISSISVASYAISILTQQTSLRFIKKTAKRRRRHQIIKGEDKISALPDDLLVHILLRLYTKDVLATMILSKRWQYVWTMVPRLGYTNINDDDTNNSLFGRLLGRFFHKSEHQQRCLWRFIDKSLQLHKGPLLTLVIELIGPSRCHVDVGKWIANAVDRRVCELLLRITWTSLEPANLCKSLYTCDTLVKLHLSDKIIVDVPSRVSLPSLKRNEGIWGSLVIDSPALREFFYRDFSGDSCSIENKPCFHKASIDFDSYPDDKFMRSLSSVMYLELDLSGATAAWCNAINFPKLVKCALTLLIDLDWLELLMGLLQNSPNLKALFIYQSGLLPKGPRHCLSRVCNAFRLMPGVVRPPAFLTTRGLLTVMSSVPGCFSSHLEIFEWTGYIGRSKEKETITYIFANYKCLKRAHFSMKSTCKDIDREKMMKELKSMCRVSTSSQLLFSTWNFRAL
ncbi:putative F-box/FBD/LRR-repeat protein At5g52460 [Capsella rubella]|uniref:putative F-box/FBD/LRR-repeat protein At5g52460 n=1 Tax=Capsella rubella TaxID=81985 RepID=UPI000CD56F5F|nr:putative F-box/FBD/LRR-repeat protein At5g52460 [Capsella rubella]